jgi:hypothetical protein
MERKGRLRRPFLVRRLSLKSPDFRLEITVPNVFFFDRALQSATHSIELASKTIDPLEAKLTDARFANLKMRERAERRIGASVEPTRSDRPSSTTSSAPREAPRRAEACGGGAYDRCIEERKN